MVSRKNHVVARKWFTHYYTYITLSWKIILYSGDFNASWPKHVHYIISDIYFNKMFDVTGHTVFLHTWSVLDVTGADPLRDTVTQRACFNNVG